MIEWTTALSLAGRLAKQGYDRRHALQRYWTMAKAALNVGSTQIVVTGHSAAGKSVLTGQIHGSARELFFEMPTESLVTEVEAVTLGEWTKLVRVLPGQQGRRTGGEIEAFQDNTSLEGVVHVVDFGYVAPRDPMVTQTLIERDKLSTVELLRERNLKLEVADLREVLSNIRKSHLQTKRPKWLLVAVNKVDLYSAGRGQALKHYHPLGETEFSQALRALQLDLGAQNLAIYVSPVCAHETDFAWNKEVVASSLQPQEQTAILRDFVKTLIAICALHE
jgi:hypothetical protein